jgi:hypothetical protein
MRGKIML